MDVEVGGERCLTLGVGFMVDSEFGTTYGSLL